MRRSNRDVALGRFLAILQVYRHKQTGNRWVVRQIHRADCHVELHRDTDNRRVCITFAKLRDNYNWVAAAPERIA